MAQEFTREKLSVADAFGNPVYIGSTKTTIHTVPANSQDTITLYLKFGRTARCEVTLFRSDGTNDYELPNKYLGASGSIVPVEITNVQAGNTIKAQLSGASPNTKIYVTSGEISNAYVNNTDSNGSDELVIFTDKFQTGTPRYLNVSDFNWGAYTAPTDFRYVQTFKYFPDTGYFVFSKSSGTGSGWWVYDVYENKVAFYSGSYDHSATERGVVWFGDTVAFGQNTAGYTINFADPASPVYVSTSSLPEFGQVGWFYKVSSDVFGTLNASSSYPTNTFRVNSDGTITHLSTSSSVSYLSYQRYASGTFANGNYYVSKSEGNGSYYAGIEQIDPTTGAISAVVSSLSSGYDSRYARIVVACPERNEFWYFSYSGGSYAIAKYDLAASTLTQYSNSRAVAEVQGAKAFYDSATDLIWVQDGDDYIGWDPDTQAWTRDSLSMTDTEPGGYTTTITALGVINNGTNDYLFGARGNTRIHYYNLDTNAEGTVSGSGNNKWDSAVHNATNAVYMSGSDGWLDHWDFSSTTPSYTSAIYGPSQSNFTTHFYQLYVDQTNNHLYATDYNSNLHKIDINASTGALSYNSTVNLISSSTYRESPKIIDVANQKYIAFRSSSVYWADMSTGATTFTNINLTDSGIQAGLTDYSSAFSFHSDTSDNYGISGAVYDEANNIAYVPFRYNNGTTYRTGVLKLDISQVGVTNSSIYVDHYIIQDSSAYYYLWSQKNLDNNIIAVGTTNASQQYYLDVSSGTVTLSIPKTFSSTTRSGFYYSSTSSFYSSGDNYKLEGRVVNPGPGSGAITTDFSLKARTYYNTSSGGQAGYLGSNAHTENNYSDASSAQRDALDVDKGNGTTGHVNRVTTTA